MSAVDVDRESETLLEAAARAPPKSKLIEQLQRRGGNEKGTQDVLALRLVHEVKIEAGEIIDLLDLDSIKNITK